MTFHKSETQLNHKDLYVYLLLYCYIASLTKELQDFVTHSAFKAFTEIKACT